MVTAIAADPLNPIAWQIIVCAIVGGLLSGMLMRLARWTRPLNSLLVVVYIATSIMVALFALRLGIQLATRRDLMDQETRPFIIFDLVLCGSIYSGKMAVDVLIRHITHQARGVQKESTNANRSRHDQLGHDSSPTDPGVLRADSAGRGVGRRRRQELPRRTHVGDDSDRTGEDHGHSRPER